MRRLSKRLCFFSAVSLICFYYSLVPSSIAIRQQIPASSLSGVGVATQHDINNFKNPIQALTGNSSNTVELASPIFGKNHPNSDAVFVFAYGYQPPPILRFVESLINTGYDGDIVLGIDYDTLIKSLNKGGENISMAGESFKSYLEYKSRHNNLVVYDVKLECDKEILFCARHHSCIVEQ